MESKGKNPNRASENNSGKNAKCRVMGGSANPINVKDPLLSIKKPIDVQRYHRRAHLMEIALTMLRIYGFAGDIVFLLYPVVLRHWNLCLRDFP